MVIKVLGKNSEPDQDPCKRVHQAPRGWQRGSVALASGAVELSRELVHPISPLRVGFGVDEIRRWLCPHDRIAAGNSNGNFQKVLAAVMARSSALPSLVGAAWNGPE